MSSNKSHQNQSGASADLNTRDAVGEAADYVSTPVYSKSLDFVLNGGFFRVPQKIHHPLGQEQHPNWKIPE